MYALSELGRLSVGLLVAGLAGVLLALLYQCACASADWDLMSSRVRRRRSVISTSDGRWAVSRSCCPSPMR